jgi:hypothetical protein
LVAPKSATQSVTGVGVAGAVELRQPVRDCGFHSPNHDIEDSDCCGGGRVNEGHACYTGKPYWGVTKKACNVEQYEATPMDGSTEDGQAGCTRNPYWGATKNACVVDQYGALPMDGSKDGKAGALAMVPVGLPAMIAVAQGPVTPVMVLAGAPTMTVEAKEPTTLDVGPARAPAPAMTKGGPTEGWGRATVVVPTAVAVGELAATMTPTARSREAVAAT